MNKYSINVIWSDEDKAYVASIPEFDSLSAFGDTQEEAIDEAKTALKGFLEVYKEDGCKLPEPQTLNTHSGQTRLRLPKILHSKLSRQAEREGVSLNTYMVHLLSENHLKFQLDKRLREIQNTTYINVPHEEVGLMPVRTVQKYIVQFDWEEENLTNITTK